MVKLKRQPKPTVKQNQSLLMKMKQQNLSMKMTKLLMKMTMLLMKMTKPLMSQRMRMKLLILMDFPRVMMKMTFQSADIG